MTAANELADLLADILENMQQSLSQGSGQGKGSFQLQDIIMSQEELKERMQGMGQGQGKQQKEGGKEQGSSQSEQGDRGKEGEQGEKDNQTKKQGKEGKDGEDGSGTGSSMNEQLLNDLYEIYKEQEEIRQLLEKQLEDMISNEDRKLANRILRQMQQFQDDLLENGVTKRTNDRLNAIQYQLLKLKDAEVKQGKLKERESQTAVKVYTNPLISQERSSSANQIQTEILNRQALPLRRNYQKRVQRYFNKND